MLSGTEFLELTKSAPLIAIFVLFLIVFSQSIKNFMKFIDKVMKDKEKEVEDLRQEIEALSKSIDDFKDKIQENAQLDKNNIIKLYNQLDSLKQNLSIISYKIDNISREE